MDRIKLKVTKKNTLSNDSVSNNKPRTATNQNVSNNNSGSKSVFNILLSSAVIAALVTGIFSLCISLNNNKILREIEMDKYEYELHSVRYEELQEFLIYFSEFKVYDSSFIHKFDIDSEEYSIDKARDMQSESIEEFSAKLLQLNPYLSDEALVIIDMEDNMDAFTLEIDDIDLDNLTDVEKINSAMKDHMMLVNSEFNDFAAVIIKAITYDIFNDYVPVGN